jgi:O-methyltransferase
MSDFTQDLLNKFPIISDQVNKNELAVILRELERILDMNIPGGVVELGCYEGTTSLFIQRVLRAKDQREFHVYDSFEGLPKKHQNDQSPAGTQFIEGKLFATKLQLITNFKKAGLPPPAIHKAWFADLSPAHLPHPIAFAFLDSDFYDSIFTSFKLIWPHLSSGATVIVDDYQNEALPGAGRAVDDWLASHKHKKFQIEQSLAIIRT